jgi:predicted FMN-binding regulatory protein PaiB
VGFEIIVEKLEAKFNLSQNRPRANQAWVPQSLEASSGSTISGV